MRCGQYRVFRWLGPFPTHDYDLWDRLSAENVVNPMRSANNNASGKVTVFGRFWGPWKTISCQIRSPCFVEFPQCFLPFCIFPCYVHHFCSLLLLSAYWSFSGVLRQRTTHSAQRTAHNAQRTTHNAQTQHTTHTKHTQTPHALCENSGPMWSGCWASPAWICLLSLVSAVIQLPAPTVARSVSET